MQNRFRLSVTPFALLGLTLFLLPWLWVLKTPATRSLFVKQVTGNTEFAPAPPWTHSLPYPYGSRGGMYSTLHNIPSSLAANSINDPQVQAKIAEQDAENATPRPPGAPKTAELNAYQGLIKRFPRESWFYAHYLRVAMSSFKDERLGGMFSSPVPLSPYANAPESTGAPPNFSPQQLEAALKIARQGQASEPDNAFFGLCEGVLLWMGHHDEEAWRALHRASLLSRYDDHSYDEMAASIAIAGKLRGSLLWEEQYVVTALDFFPQYAKLREKARQWSWAAWKLERTGHHREAITKRADLARLFSKTMHGRNTLLGGMVGEAIQAIMWSGNPNRKVSRPSAFASGKQSPALRTNLQAQNFAAYARAHGEPALATETIRLGQETGNFSVLTGRAIATSTANNLPSALIYQTRALWWLACGLLLSGSTILAVWLFCSALLVRTETQRPTPRFVVPVVLLCFILTGLIYGKCNGAAIESIFNDNSTLSSSLTLFIGVMQVSAFLLPLLLPALVCVLPTWWHLRKVRRTARQNSEDRMLPRDMRPFIWSFISWCALLTAALGWIVAAGTWATQPQDLRLDILGFVTTLDGEALTTDSIIIASIASLLLLVGWLLRWRFFVPATERPVTYSALRRFQTVLGVLLIVGSWSYALTLSATLPPRREADRLSELALQQGEIGALETMPTQTTYSKGSTP